MIKDIARRLMEGAPSTEERAQVESDINELSDDDRRAVQKLIGESPAPRNLFYNYSTQAWI